MKFGIDIEEDEIKSWGHEILENLLRDRTTGENIIWATDDYASKGEGYSFYDFITPEKICGENRHLIQPRISKSLKNKKKRIVDKAEVFTPSWLCNFQNNIADEIWFGRKHVFNKDDVDNKTWEPYYTPILHPAEKPWTSYVAAQRMEITCGEAPYLVSRYDTTTGEFIPLENRIGLLDRKLRVVCENTESIYEWLKYAEIAYMSIYGYEWQGDSLLLAREALLVSFVEYYQGKFHSLPAEDRVKRIAYIISWNIWQMDGLKFVIPGSCHEEKKTHTGLFESFEEIVPCEGCEKGDFFKHNGIYCLIKDWEDKDPVTGEYGKTIRFVDLLKKK